MVEKTLLADRFEEHRTRLKAVAYRLLGSLSEAEDAVQQAWLRLTRADTDEIVNLGGWLTTVVSRICLDMLRSRQARAEEAFDTHVPDPIVTSADWLDPEHEAVLADSVGVALQVVLDRLNPPERLAFVLHDMFAVPFDDVATLAGRTPDSVRQLASRARRRVADSAPIPDKDVARQRDTVDAFFAAARGGDFEALVAVLDPDVVLHADGGRPEVSALVRGAATVAKRAIMFRAPAATVVPVLVNGAAGVIVVVDGKPTSLMAFTVRDGRIAQIDSIADPDRLASLGLPLR
ncbi:MAG TPA: sigma-70 family RNA polymerase sigma factor [Acidimicrobiales bacterium]|nr:sigma-70 family RNA polymerase sigma factor [Acidimicrobiales bacterium]